MSYSDRILQSLTPKYGIICRKTVLEKAAYCSTSYKVSTASAIQQDPAESLHMTSISLDVIFWYTHRTAQYLVAAVAQCCTHLSMLHSTLHSP